MNTAGSIVLAVLSASSFASAAHATIVNVEITGAVDFNVFVNGPFQGIPSGTPATLSFEVDSDNFLNSPNFPTRGYAIDQSTFELTVGKVAVGLLNPFPAGQTPYFVLRNNDPAVDGFFISTNVDVLQGVALDFGNVKMNFLRTFDISTVWPTLDILDALGAYGFENMSSYEWTLNVGPGTPMEIGYQTITLSEVQACLPDIAPIGSPPGNGTVNVDDLLAVINSWGPCANPNDCPADIAPAGPPVGNDVVNVDDLLAVINGWGACP